MKKVKEHLEKTNRDRVEAFESGAKAYATKIVANFKNYDFVSFTPFTPFRPKYFSVHCRNRYRWHGCPARLSRECLVPRPFG